MKLAQINIGIILIGFMCAYTWGWFTSWQNGAAYFMWAKGVDLCLVYTVACLLKLKSRTLYLSYVVLSVLYFLRVCWEILALKFGYVAASHKYIMVWLYILTVISITIITVKGWKHSKASDFS